MFINLLCSIVALGSLVILILFVATIRFRLLDSPDAIFAKLQPRQVTLLPFVGDDDETAEQDRMLWHAIGGIRGIFRLLRDAFGLLALCAALDYQKKDPAEYELNVKRVETIAVSLLGAVGEAIFHRIAPWMPCPYLRLSAREYWRMCLSLQTLVSVYSPSLIERVAQVL